LIAATIWLQLAYTMAKKPAVGNFKIGLRFEDSTVERFEALRKEIPAGSIPDLVRYLVFRGMDAIEADRRRVLPEDSPGQSRCGQTAAGVSAAKRAK
jgi:hypothetical protein